MSNRKVTPKMATRIQELRGMGWGQEDIAKEVGVSSTTVCRSLNSRVMMRNKLTTCRDRQAKHMEARAVVGVGIIRCSHPGCGITDWRIIEIGHPNGDAHLDYGNHGKRTGKYGHSQSFYLAIVSGERSTEGLNLVCANHNYLDDIESGRRVFNLDGRGVRVIIMLDSPCVWPDCRITDLRILTKNHKGGGGSKEFKAYGNNMGLNQAILRGDVPLDGYNVLCWNHQILYEYQEGRRIDYTNMDIDAEVATRLPDKVGESPSLELSTTLSQITKLRTKIESCRNTRTMGVSRY